MNQPRAGDQPSKGIVRLLLRLAIALVLGAGAGLAALAFTYLQLGWTSRNDDVAYSLGGGIGCLTAGTAIYLSCRLIEELAWLWRMPVALLLGTGVAFSTLGVFWWMQEFVFVYKQYPDLNYLLGEVGGFLGPGAGLLTWGITLLLLYFLRPDDKRRLLFKESYDTSLVAMPPLRRDVLGFFSRLALALILGAGTGLSSVAVTYLLLGRNSRTAGIAGFLAGGFGCLTTGMAMFLACLRAEGLPRLWPLMVTLFLLVGMVLFSAGVFQAATGGH